MKSTARLQILLFWAELVYYKVTLIATCHSVKQYGTKVCYNGECFSWRFKFLLLAEFSREPRDTIWEKETKLLQYVDHDDVHALDLRADQTER